MSVAGTEEVLKPILLRSSTPAPNEKVLKYLEGMNRDSTNYSPPASIADYEDYQAAKSPMSEQKAWNSPNVGPPGTPKAFSQSQKGGGLNGEAHILHSPSNHANGRLISHGGGEDDDDANSNTQDGVRSEIAATPLIQNREPGPDDPPGPRYESYDSGPSFGNFGPLPADDHPTSSNPFANGTWQPNWGNNNHQWPNGAEANAVSSNAGGLTPGYPTRVPLPDSVASPRATSVNIGIESPSSPRSKARNSQAASKSQKAPSAISDNDDRTATRGDIPNKFAQGQSRSPSKVPTNRGSERPLSPLSAKSRATAKSPGVGTVYPALPESAVGDSYTSPASPTSPRSPRSRVYSPSKAGSVSPSDSPSQTKVHKSISKSQSGKDASYLQKSTRSSPSEEPQAAEFSPRSGSRAIPNQAGRSSQAPGSVMSGSNTHQNRPFSPYRHAATNEDLLHAAVRGRSFVIPEAPDEDKEQSVAAREPSVAASRHSKQPSMISNGKQSSVATSRRTHTHKGESHNGGDATPTPSRPHSPGELNQDEEGIVREILTRRSAMTPRTSYYAASTLEPEVVNSHFHDMDLCVLLNQENDPNVHEVVKRALRKAVRQRVKKLGMKYDHESIREYKKSFHDHDPSVHLRPDYAPSIPEEPPEWAKELIQGMVIMQQRIEGLGPKIEGLKASQNQSFGDGSRFRALDYNEDDDFSRTPMTQTVNIHTQPTGTLADSMFQPAETEIIEGSNPDHDGSHRHDDAESDDDGHGHGYNTRGPQTDGETHTRQGQSEFMSETRDDSPGQQFLEEELYKLRQKPQGSQSARSHRTWELARDDDDDPEAYVDDEIPEHRPTASGLPTIPDSNGGGYTDHRPTSPPLPPIPQENRRDLVATPQEVWHPGDYSNESQSLPPWQKIHQRLLSWAIIWPLSELDAALNSTTRGHQVDEVALSIWSTQTYKRYVRARMTDVPQGVVDRLFVPPNMADAISTAVYNGRHGDACGMLRDLWSPFGLEGMPRLLVVLAKHRSDDNHWVVHRFSLPDGGLTTYDSYPERTLPDGRPLGWWFAIRVAWPNAIYPSPDHLMQKMVRLHRPMQLNIDNSVAAAGIWRNILMGSRAERSLDLERLRDLINTEVKNLRQRKLMGKLSIGAPRPAWEDMN